MSHILRTMKQRYFLKREERAGLYLVYGLGIVHGDPHFLWNFLSEEFAWKWFVDAVKTLPCEGLEEEHFEDSAEALKGEGIRHVG